jgi:hypothetical protein
MKRTALSGLGLLTAAALLTDGIAYLIYFFLVASIAGAIVPILVIAILSLLAAGFVIGRVRLAPLLAVVLAVSSTGLDLSQPETIYNLAHPVYVSFYALNVIFLACALVVGVCGIGATIQSYRRSQPQLPRGVKAALTGLIGTVIGLILTALIAAANPLAEMAGTNPASEPTVHMGPGGFSQNIVLVPKGGRLRLIDDGAFTHVLRNGTWATNGTAMPSIEPGAPILSDLQINGGSIEIGPFTTAGEFDIYCTIHVGMNLTVLVHQEPARITVAGSDDRSVDFVKAILRLQLSHQGGKLIER